MATKIWRCDVCKVQTFSSLREATEHESKCTIHPFFQARKRSADDDRKPSSSIATNKATGSKKKPRTGGGKKSSNLNGFFGVKKVEHSQASKRKPQGTVVTLDDADVIDVDQEPDEKTRREQQAALEFYSKKKEVKKISPPQRTRRTRLQLPCPHVIPPCDPALDRVAAIEVTWKSRQTSPLIESANEMKLIASDAECQPAVLAPDALLEKALHDHLEPTSPIVRRSHDFYTDQHYHPIDSEAEAELKSFIERFKIRRQAAIERGAKRHAKLNGANKRLKKKPKRKKRAFGEDYESEDDLWEDEDDQVRAAATLCLLTGPVGCAKSSTVHRVAAATGCETVLELYPGQPRGGAQLRKVLEESTQSHSSKDMFQKSKASSALVNSDDEDEEASKSGSAVTVILLDEADTVFDSDAGFWSTVMEVAVKSKCPIVLTANGVPKGLTSAYTHIRMDRPSVPDCASWLEQVAVDAGYRVAGNLEKVALLAHCDMRRMLLALEMFSLQQTEGNINDDTSAKAAAPKDMLKLVDQDVVAVESVEPRSILADEQTILTVKGRNFHRLIFEPKDESGGFPCQVFLGEDVVLRGCIVDPSTILAVFVPFKLPSFLDKTGLYRGTRKRSLAAAHPHVTVGSVRASTAANAVNLWDFPNGEKFLGCAAHCTLDLQFPGSLPHAYSPNRRTKKDFDDDEGETEFVFGEESPTAVTTTVGLYARSQFGLADERAAALLHKRVLSLQSGADEAEDIDATIPTAGDCAMETLIDLDRMCELLSDAAYLQHLEEVPFLAGACKGFGYEYTEERRSNEKNKPPSEEVLFASGYKEHSYFYGDPDTYMVQPTDTLERRLLNQTERNSTTNTVAGPTPKEQGEGDSCPVFIDWVDEFLPGKRSGSLDATSLVPNDKIDDWTQTHRANEELNLFKNLHRSEWLSFLEFQLNAGEYDVRYYLRFQCMDRAGDAFAKTLSRTADGNATLLDYVPLLRCMVVHDKAHRSTIAAPEAQDNPRRRTTRRSRLNATCPYLELLLPDYVRKSCDASELQEMEDMFLRSSLLNC